MYPHIDGELIHGKFDPRNVKQQRVTAVFILKITMLQLFSRVSRVADVLSQLFNGIFHPRNVHNHLAPMQRHQENATSDIVGCVFHWKNPTKDLSTSLFHLENAITQVANPNFHWKDAIFQLATCVCHLENAIE